MNTSLVRLSALATKIYNVAQRMWYQTLLNKMLQSQANVELPLAPFRLKAHPAAVTKRYARRFNLPPTIHGAIWRNIFMKGTNISNRWSVWHSLKYRRFLKRYLLLSCIVISNSKNGAFALLYPNGDSNEPVNLTKYIEQREHGGSSSSL